MVAYKHFIFSILSGNNMHKISTKSRRKIVLHILLPLLDWYHLFSVVSPNTDLENEVNISLFYIYFSLHIIHMHICVYIHIFLYIINLDVTVCVSYLRWNSKDHAWPVKNQQQLPDRSPNIWQELGSFLELTLKHYSLFNDLYNCFLF